ncbi:MAG: GH25 family lysozyme [Allorhizobium sp.]
MRLSSVSMIIAGLLLSGCVAGSGAEQVLAVAPSSETTGAISRPSAPVPSASVGTAQTPQAQGGSHELAWAGPVSGSLPTTPMTSAAGMPASAQQTVAMRLPDNPYIAPETAAEPGARSRIYSRRFRDAHPINFGKSSPHKLAVHGVDISRWQDNMDWHKLRSEGANFAFIKATDGGDHLDPMFKTNWRRAKEAGVKRGAYHFFYWCRTAGEQADWFIRNVPKEKGALPPVIDVEWNHESSCSQRISRTRVLEKIKVFAERLEKHYGQKPIIYTAPDFYEDNLQGELLDYPFWLRSVAAHPSVRYPGRKWVFWQYSGSGLSKGVKGRIDLNVFHGSEEDWHDWVRRAT